MNLDKAIEINGFIKQDVIPIGELDQLQALNLGIEALKWVERCRRGIYWDTALELPGETKD